MVVVGVVVSIGATLAVGHAQGGAGWLAVHRPISTERMGGLPRLGRSIGRALGRTLDQVFGASTTAARTSTELAELAPITRESSRVAASAPALPGEPVAASLAVSEAGSEVSAEVGPDDPRDPDSREAVRAADPGSHRSVTSGSGPAIHEVASREARIRRGTAPPSSTHPRARQPQPVAFGVALARTTSTTSTKMPATTEPPRPMALPAPEAPVAPALPIVDTPSGGLGAAGVPATPEPPHLMPVDENAPLPLDEDGQDGLVANRPLGIVE